jgi:hypothetical protein
MNHWNSYYININHPLNELGVSRPLGVGTGCQACTSAAAVSTELCTWVLHGSSWYLINGDIGDNEAHLVEISDLA